MQLPSFGKDVISTDIYIARYIYSESYILYNSQIYNNFYSPSTTYLVDIAMST